VTELKKIVVIGISGTGKSTLSRMISEIAKLPLYHMDSFIWGEDWKESGTLEIEQSLTKIVATHSWIVEGWIDNYSKELLTEADLVLYLDFPGWAAALGGVQRWWKFRGKKRPEMPKGCVEGFGLKYIQVMLQRTERPHIEKMLAEFKPRNVIRYGSRRQAKRSIPELFN
jgi:adenylate kinase family enzyme